MRVSLWTSDGNVGTKIVFLKASWLKGGYVGLDIVILESSEIDRGQKAINHAPCLRISP